MSEQIPHHLPETLSTEVAAYLQFSNELLTSTLVEDVLFTDYLTKKHHLEHRAKLYNRDLFASPGVDPNLELDDVEKFYSSKLPLALMLSEHDKYRIVDLVKVDDFGQVYAYYTINLFSLNSENEREIIPSFDGYEVSNGLYYAAMTLLEKQQQLGWKPTFDPSDSDGQVTADHH